MMSPYLRSQPAQGLNEYALTGGLVVIACIVSLSVLGSNVSDMLGGTISKRTTTLAAGVANKPSNTPPETSPSVNTPPDSAFGRTLTVQLPNGESQQFRIPDPRTIIDTDGTDGVTKAYLAQLDQLIQAFKKVLPENDPRIAALERLSLKGHEVANAQHQAEINNNNGNYADVSSLIFMEQGFVSRDKSLSDFKTLDQCSHFGTQGGPRIREGYVLPSQCAPSISNSTRILQKEENRSLIQNFAVLAADIRRDLKDQEKSGLLPLFDYFAGNIIQSAVATSKSVVPDPVVQKPVKGQERDFGKPEEFAFTQNRKQHFKSNFTEVQANGLCGMSGFETCQRQNGQAVQNNANTTSPINTPERNPVNTTHSGSTAGASSLSTRRSW